MWTPGFHQINKWTNKTSKGKQRLTSNQWTQTLLVKIIEVVEPVAARCPPCSQNRSVLWTQPDTNYLYGSWRHGVRVKTDSKRHGHGHTQQKHHTMFLHELSMNQSSWSWWSCTASWDKDGLWIWGEAEEPHSQSIWFGELEGKKPELRTSPHRPAMKMPCSSWNIEYLNISRYIKWMSNDVKWISMKL